MVKGKISILEPFCPTYLIGKCIDQREREESAMDVVRRGSEKEEERLRRSAQ